MWLMYSSTTILMRITVRMLRAVWNSRSSSQAGYARRSERAMRLCSRRNSTPIITNPTCRLPVSLPNANSWRRWSSVIWLVADDGDRVEPLAVSVVEVGRVLLPVDDLGLQEPVLERAQLAG